MSAEPDGADDRRWAEIASIHAEMESGDSSPEGTLQSRGRRQGAAKAHRLTRALSFDDQWAGITEARARRQSRLDDLAA